MEEQKNLLEMSNITKSFGPVEVLHGVQLNIKQSSVHILLGENGAGDRVIIRPS